MVDLLAAVAATWGTLMAISPFLQIRRILIRRSAADVSLGYMSVLQVGFALWVAYGVALGNLALIVPNSVAFLVGLTTIVLAWNYRAGPPQVD